MCTTCGQMMVLGPVELNISGDFEPPCSWILCKTSKCSELFLEPYSGYSYPAYLINFEGVSCSLLAFTFPVLCLEPLTQLCLY